VLFVVPDSVVTVDDYQTPSLLGLTGGSGVWSQLGGTKHAGEGIIIGDVDTGIRPENPTFAALPASSIHKKVAARFHGICDAGSTGPAMVCNNKVIGARYYGPGSIVIKPGEYLSPRDYDGHGSHTASTAAGDYGVQMIVEGHDFGKFSGLAPAARIAAYKALWEKADGTGASGNNSNIVKAIDDAVGDGVDVINYSISGSATTENDPVALSFYHAAQAGIFVSASAGNDAPAASTVAKNYPWVTTVAAGSDDVVHQATVTLGNGSAYTGVARLCVAPGPTARPRSRSRRASPDS